MRSRMSRLTLLPGALSLLSLSVQLYSCGGNPGEGEESPGPDTPNATATPTAAPGTQTPETTAVPGDTATRCAQIADSVSAAGFGSAVSIACDEAYAYLTGDTYPAHDKMNGITGTNEQVPVPAPGYTSPIVLAPSLSDTPTSNDGALGVAVNGVPIYDYSSQGALDLYTYDVKYDTKAQGQLDYCNGHAGRGDDYHYHASPTCMIAAMKNAGPSAILGWAFDGYPLYGSTAPDGSALPAGSLDVCNGMKDATFGYRYHTSDTHPYILQCLVGRVDTGIFPRVPPLDNAAGGGKPPGTPPEGGVKDLEWVESADGTRTMTYTYDGGSYYIQYKPSKTAGCYDFEQKTVTNGGVVEKATYCREAL